MKLNFISKTLLIVFSFIIISILILQYLNRFYNDKNDKNALYVWGDSQTYQGLDLELLKKNLEIKVYTSAKHGAGVYDFLVFTENVPQNSEVLVGVSQFVFLRDKASDYNRTGIEINPLINLLSFNYSIGEVYKVVNQNLRIYRDLFLDKTYLYDSCTVEDLIKNLKFYDQFYSKLPKYYFSKIELFKNGLQRLENKGCKIHILSFPFSNLLIKKIKNKSVYKKALKDIQSIGDENVLSTLYINQINCDSCFYDLSHLNKFGAEILTNEILKKFKD